MQRKTTLVTATLLSGILLGAPATGLACGSSQAYDVDDYRGAPLRGGRGTVLGALFGGIVGSHIGGYRHPGGLIAGTLLGAVVGHEIGASLEDADNLRAQEVLERNRIGEASAWVNPDTDARIVVTPTRTVRAATDGYCREYTAEVRVGGEAQEAYGTACRQPDGSWQIVN
ncbi:MAG: glycine zipper 2TM domain-containing protein [Deltaproteobacteria bacterium]|nr:glycine zipper 2TM domain-containing protein [Deltaproteobacteria bacterium]